MPKKKRTSAENHHFYVLWRDRHREQHDKSLFERNLRRLYKMTPAEFDAMVKAQGGLCAICGEKPAGTKRRERLFIDHDHATGQVRGLLCHLCNLGIAAFERDTEIVFRAYDYLQFYKR